MSNINMTDKYVTRDGRAVHRILCVDKPGENPVAWCDETGFVYNSRSDGTHCYSPGNDLIPVPRIVKLECWLVMTQAGSFPFSEELGAKDCARRFRNQGLTVHGPERIERECEVRP
jgi:hypothetical protein